MRFAIESVHLGEVKVVRPVVRGDRRGWFMEAYRADSFRELGLPDGFEQDNHSRSEGGVVRGLHFQWDPPMGKLMRVSRGRAFVVAVDIRKGSPTVGRWYGREISEEDQLQVWAPAGFARGFCTLSDVVEVQYKCTATYNAPCETGILWNDPAIGITWPLENPVLSDRDARAQTLADWLARPEATHLAY